MSFRQSFGDLNKEDISIKMKVLGMDLEIPVIGPSNPDLAHFMLHREITRNGGVGVIQASNFENLPLYQIEGMHPPVARVGTEISELDHVERLYNGGVRVFLIETLRPGMALVHQMNAIKSKFPESKVIVGNIVDARIVTEILKYGTPDAIKVGLSTNSKDVILEFGFDRPLTETIEDVKRALSLCGKNTAIVAEGSIYTSKEFATIIKAGADLIMSEELLGGSEESAKEAKATMMGPIVRYSHKFFPEVSHIALATGTVKEELTQLKNELINILYLSGSENWQSFRDKSLYK